jgi:NarL family two-component system response regulator LiaR
VLAADDHDLPRKGVAMVIQNCADFELVGEACDGKQAVDLCVQHRPDVVVMDTFMPHMDGVTAVRIIRRQNPSTRVIVLSAFVGEDVVQEALSAGAISFLLKDVSAETLRNAIYDAYLGKATLAPEVTQILVAAAQHPGQHRLTQREREVLRLMMCGLNNTQIADQLTVSISTIKKHVSSILMKLKTTSRTEAVAIAVRQKLVLE